MAGNQGVFLLCRTITSAAMDGCDYVLYATEVMDSHSLSLVSIDFPDSLCLYC